MRQQNILQIPLTTLYTRRTIVLLRIFIIKMLNTENENSVTLLQPGKGKSVNALKATTERKSLHTLQPRADLTGLCRHGDLGSPKKAKAKKFAPSKKSVKVFEDSGADKRTARLTPDDSLDGSTCGCQCHKKAKREAAEEDAMCNVEDWQQLAEARREALNESLIENAELHDKIQELENENAQLTKLADQAEFFAETLKGLGVLNENEETDGDEVAEDEQQEGDDYVDSESEREEEGEAEDNKVVAVDPNEEEDGETERENIAEEEEEADRQPKGENESSPRASGDEYDTDYTSSYPDTVSTPSPVSSSTDSEALCGYDSDC